MVYALLNCRAFGVIEMVAADAGKILRRAFPPKTSKPINRIAARTIRATLLMLYVFLLAFTLFAPIVPVPDALYIPPARRVSGAGGGDTSTFGTGNGSTFGVGDDDTSAFRTSGGNGSTFGTGD